MMDFLRRVWSFLHSFFSILEKSRFSLIIVLLAVISFEYVGQIKDILVGLGHPDNKMQVVYFILAVNWLAFQSWGWARYIYSLCYQETNGERGSSGLERFLITWLPRAYAMLTFFAAYRAASHAQVEGVANGIIVVAILVLLFLYSRRRIAEIIQPHIKYSGHRLHHYFTALVMLVTASYAIAAPVSFGNNLGAGAVAFLGLGSIIPIGTLLVSAARTNGFPVVGSLLVFAAIISPLNDNHHVRDIEDQYSNTQKHSLQDSLTDWLEQADPDQPMVLVATAGGGLRASYWTGVVLGRFQDIIPDFSKQVFAISGVSGGSVGAVFYNAALTVKNDCSSAPLQAPCFEDKLLSAIGRDYLAPTATSMLYADLLQRFIPYPIFPDRAAALEESWEQGFADVYPEASCGLHNSFTDLYSKDQCKDGQQWLPRLLINGTYEETGKRILTTSFKVEPEVFLDTHDFYALNLNKEKNKQEAIRASTAALNSARFTYLSPAGTFGQDVGHIIDGGYFENYGAATLSNLISWLKLNDQKLSNRKLIVIAISNGLNIPAAQFELDTSPATAAPQTFMNEILAPIIGLANTRSGHARLAYKQLAQDAERGNLGANTKMVHFYLEANEGAPPPLGWILSEEAKQNMRQQLTKKHNCPAFEQILDEFGLDQSSCQAYQK